MRPDVPTGTRGRLAALLAALLTALLVGATACSGGSAVSTVDPTAASALISKGATVIDVRTPAEFAAGHIPQALNIDVQAADFEQRIRQLPTDASYVVYCRSGNRSAAAAKQMADLGFTQVKDLGGLATWADAGLPVVTTG